MAKMKKGKGGGDNDLDLDDLEDFGDLGEDMQFGDEAGIDDDNREPSRSKVVTDLAKEAGEGALESVIKNTAKKALPEDYSANYHEAMDLADFTSEVITKNKMALNKSAYRLGKEVSKILPFKIGMLERYLEDQQSEFEGYKAQSEEQMREASVASETASIFDKQLDVQKSLYARTEAREEMEQKERLSQNKVSNEVLANIDGNIAHQTAFTTQISKEYYKRSLELQFKSYYVQADTLKTMREHYKAFAIQFTNIEKNTGLPDFVKLRTTEAVQDNMRQQTVSSIYTSLIGNSKFLERMKKKMGGFVQEKVENVTQAMDGMTDMLDMVNSSAEGTGKSGGSMIASLLASLGGETLGEKISGKISPKLKEMIKDNKIINTGANYMGILGTSASSALEAAKAAVGQKAQESEESGSWLGKTVFGGLKSFLDAGTPGADEAAAVTNKGYLTHNQAAIFDNNVHRSITEVIPMYLARILQTNSTLTSMYGQINTKKLGPGFKGAELYQYDYESRKLSSAGAIAENVKNKIFKDKSVKERSKGLSKSMLTDTVNTASKSGLSKLDLDKLKKGLNSKDSQNELSEYISKASEVTGGDMDYNTLFKDYEKNAQLKALVDSNDKLAKLIKTMNDYTPQDTKVTDQRLKDIKRDYPIETLKNVIQHAATLSGSSTPTVTSDKVASAISKGFVNYITKTGKDVTPRSVVDRSAFKFMADKDFNDDVKEVIAIFGHDVRKILEQGDMQLTSGVELMFAGLNKTLREERDISPKVFQALYDLYPELIGTGVLDAENTREGQLKIDNADDKYVESSKLVELGGFKPIEIKRLRDEKASDSMIDKFTKKLKEGLGTAKRDVEDLVKFAKENKGDPSAIAGKLVDTLKTYKTAASEEVAKAATKVKNGVGDLSKRTEDLLNNWSDKALEVAVLRYGTTIDAMDKMIEAKEADIVQYVEKINDTKAAVSELSNNKGHEKEVGKLTEHMQNLNKKEVALLKDSVAILRKQQRVLMDLVGKDKGVATEAFKTIRDSTAASLKNIQEKIAAFEAQGGTIADIKPA